MTAIPFTSRETERFVSKYIVVPNECWPWTGARMPRGYGRMIFRRQGMYAHRLAWMYWRGPIPVDLCVCHRCDNPACVNPDHLFLGTHFDNMRDCSAKGRWGQQESVIGEDNPRHKLTDAAVRDIRRRYSGSNTTKLAREFGVTTTAVRLAAQRRTWKHVE